LNGQKLYRLKTVEQWRSSIQEARQWLEQNGVDLKRNIGNVVVVKRRNKDAGAPDKGLA
jgi:hypothetical protein